MLNDGQPAANTKHAPNHIQAVNMGGGNEKYQVLRLDVDNFWGSQCCIHQTSIISVIYNASNNELICTKTLVKNCIVLTDRTLYQQWYQAAYVLPLGHMKGTNLTPEEEEILNNQKYYRKFKEEYTMKEKKNAKSNSLLEQQFQQSKLLVRTVEF